MGALNLGRSWYKAAFLCCFGSNNTVNFLSLVIHQNTSDSSVHMYRAMSCRSLWLCQCYKVFLFQFCKIHVFQIARNTTSCELVTLLRIYRSFREIVELPWGVFSIHNFNLHYFKVDVNAPPAKLLKDILHFFLVRQSCYSCIFLPLCKTLFPLLLCHKCIVYCKNQKLNSISNTTNIPLLNISFTSLNLCQQNWAGNNRA